MSAQKVLAEMHDMTALDENQFAAAYALAASPARWALERHDWKAAASWRSATAWFPGIVFGTWKRWRTMQERSGRRTRAMWPARADLADEIAAIRNGMPRPRLRLERLHRRAVGSGYCADRMGRGNKAEGIRMLRVAADHEDAIDKHPVTPGRCFRCGRCWRIFCWRRDRRVRRKGVRGSSEDFAAPLQRDCWSCEGGRQSRRRTKARAYASSSARSPAMRRRPGRNWNGPAPIWAADEFAFSHPRAFSYFQRSKNLSGAL